MKKKNLNINKGASALHIIFALLFFLMIGRFLYIQVGGQVAGVNIQEFTSSWFQSSDVLEGKRGTIYDSRGTQLATQTISYKLAAVLSESTGNYVKDTKLTAEKLAPLIGMPEADILGILEAGKDANRFQVEFGASGRSLSYSQMREIEGLELPGLIFTTSTSRTYPLGVFASYVLGHTTVDDDGNISGAMGLESSLNGVLEGRNGNIVFGVDGQGNQIPSEIKEIKEPENGNDVHLTIDATIQGFVEAALRDAEEKYNPEEMTVIAMEAKTGRILAMGTSPSFNPNLRDMTSFTNIAVESTFSPGSTMKIFTWAAAINAGVYNGDALFQSGSFYATKGGVPIRDHNRVGWGSISFDEGFYRSSNVGTAVLGMQLLGPEKAMEYYEAFGLFSQTGIDLPGEAQGTTVFDVPRDQATTMFGEGSTTTAIALVQAMSAIANDGDMMKPYVVEKIVDATTGEVLQKTEPTVVGTPIRKETAEQMRDLLSGVVTEPMGTGRAYEIEGFDVIGKTGTAQILNEAGTGFLTGHGNHLISFLGMAPKNDPEIILYVSVKKPNLSGDQAENQPSSEIFKYVMENSLQYLDITRNITTQSTEELADENSTKVSDYTNMSTESAVEEIESKGLTPIVIGDGENIVSQLPRKESSVIKGRRVFLLTDGSRTMLNIEGWSTNDVMALAELLEINIEIKGSGFVVSQSIKEGETVTVGSTLSVTFESVAENDSNG